MGVNRKFYNDLLHGLNEALDHAKGKDVKGIKVRRVSIKPLPQYKAKQIKSIRNKLCLSQTKFALLFGVNNRTVEAWESGRNIPSGPAQRLLELLNENEHLLEEHNLIEDKVLVG